MIPKRIDIEPQNDNFERLARYLAAAGDVGEKLDKLWIENCHAGEKLEDLDLAIKEIKATQAMNQTAQAGKSYHLVISFRDEQPAAEVLKDIEREFAKALGYEQHQRIVATHVNTDNFHMHVAFNKVHPETLKVHTPYRDFRVLEAVSRAMEQKHGLKVDIGRTDKLETDRRANRARDMEAHTWEQSFDSYVRANKVDLLQELDQARNWQDLHKGFAKYDLQLRLRGNGLVIAQRNGKHAVKASAIERSLSKPALEKRFGPFQAAEKDRTRPIRRYRLRPVTRHPGQQRLWRRYLAVRAGKKESLAVKAFRTWKEFLTYGAIDDPLAMAIIYSQKKIIEALVPEPDKRHVRIVPIRPDKSAKLSL